jgi:hypothetical protein
MNPVILPFGRAGGEARYRVITLVFEVYGAFCVLSLIAFLFLAAVAKLRPDLNEPDLDQEELNTGELEKLAGSAQFVNALPAEGPIVEILSRSAPPRPVKQSKHLTRRRPFLIHPGKPRRPNQAA